MLKKLLLFLFVSSKKLRLRSLFFLAYGCVFHNHGFLHNLSHTSRIQEFFFIISFLLFLVRHWSKLGFPCGNGAPKTKRVRSRLCPVLNCVLRILRAPSYRNPAIVFSMRALENVDFQKLSQ